VVLVIVPGKMSLTGKGAYLPVGKAVVLPQTRRQQQWRLFGAAPWWQDSWAAWAYEEAARGEGRRLLQRRQAREELAKASARMEAASAATEFEVQEEVGYRGLGS
jgi:hypothetical protein